MAVDVVRCRCEVGMMAAPHDFVFRVYKDGSVDVEVTPGETSQSQAAAITEYKVMGGRVMKEAESSGEPPGKTFKISFTIVRFDRWMPQTHASLLVNLRLSTVNGLGGHLCRNNQARHTSYHQERIGMQMSPLAPGSYELRGCVAFASGRVNDSCVLVLVLHRDRTLRCEFRDSLLSLFSSINGHWSRDRMWFTLEIRQPNDFARSYSFDFKCVLSSLRGVCLRDGAAFASFELRPVVIQRSAWSPSVHRYFPQSFQTISKLLLLSSVAAECSFALPSAIWIEVLSFCTDDWFTNEDDDDMAQHINSQITPPFASMIKTRTIVPLGTALVILATYLILT